MVVIVAVMIVAEVAVIFLIAAKIKVVVRVV